MELYQIAAIFKRWLPLIIAGAILAAVPAFIWAGSRPVSYEASARLLVSTPPEARPDAQLAAIQRASLYQLIAETREFASLVIADLGLEETPAELLKKISAAAAGTNAILEVTVSDPDPQRAALLANRSAALLEEQSVTSVAGDVPADIATYLGSVNDEIESTRQRIAGLEPLEITLASRGGRVDRPSGQAARPLLRIRSVPDAVDHLQLEPTRDAGGRRTTRRTSGPRTTFLRTARCHRGLHPGHCARLRAGLPRRHDAERE